MFKLQFDAGQSSSTVASISTLTTNVSSVIYNTVTSIMTLPNTSGTVYVPKKVGEYSG
jgi:hypothetical protein